MQRKDLRIKAFSLSVQAAERVELISKITGRTQTSLIEALIMLDEVPSVLMSEAELARFQKSETQSPTQVTKQA